MHHCAKDGAVYLSAEIIMAGLRALFSSLPKQDDDGMAETQDSLSSDGEAKISQMIDACVAAAAAAAKQNAARMGCAGEFLKAWRWVRGVTSALHHMRDGFNDSGIYRCVW